MNGRIPEWRRGLDPRDPDFDDYEPDGSMNAEEVTAIRSDIKELRELYDVLEQALKDGDSISDHEILVLGEVLKRLEEKV